jgi:uncharacterized protein
MFRKNRIIQDKILVYLDTASATVDQFARSMDYYLDHHLDAVFADMVHDTHELESKADDLRREIEGELYAKSLLPESRKDILTIIDKVDMIPNKAESVLRQLYTHNLELPAEYNPQIRELVVLSVDAVHLLTKAAMDALGPCEQVQDAVHVIDQKESAGDQIEQELIHHIFRNDCEPVKQILFRDIIVKIGDLLDLAAIASDTLTIFAIKRQV